MKSRYFNSPISINQSIVILITEAKFLGYTNKINSRIWLFSLEGNFVEMTYDRQLRKFLAPRVVTSDHVTEQYLSKLTMDLPF